MKTLIAFASFMLLCSVAMADNHGLYYQYGYGSRYNPQYVNPNNVQLYMIQQQIEQARIDQKNYQIRQELRDSSRGGDGGCVYCVDKQFNGGY